MAHQPYPPSYDNREGTGRYRRRGFDRLLDRLYGRPGPVPLAPGPDAETQHETTDEIMRRQRSPYLRRRLLEE